MANSEWWRGAVIYQIYPRSFMDSNADGIGDLAGITDKLDYVSSLGVDAIWISPFFTSPMKDFGYDVSDYYDVDPIFGTLDDFKKLLNKAHALGLKVMIDQVWSHSAKEHLWFKESSKSKNNPKHDWYVWSDPKHDGTAPNNWLSNFGGPAWTWDSRRQQYYLHHFLSEQPSLNLWNPAVREAIKDIASFWLDMGVDGFRLDAIHSYLSSKDLLDNPPCIPGESLDIPVSNPMSRQRRIHTTNLPETFTFVEEIRAHVDKWDGRCLLAEVGGDDSEWQAALYTQGGDRSHLAYSFGLLGSHMTKKDIVKTVNKVESVLEDGWICWATCNHDFMRVVSRVHWECAPETRAKIAIALGLSLRGSYCMYQGEELGLEQADLSFEDLVDPYDIMLYPEHMGRDGCRTPIPWAAGKPHSGFSNAFKKTWLPIPENHTRIAVAVQENDPNSTLHFTRRFMKWRQSKPAIILGSIRMIETQNENLVVFVRSQADEHILCAFNLGKEDKIVSAEGFEQITIRGFDFLCGDFK